MIRISTPFIFSLLVLSFLFPSQARAVNFGDAALTVAVGTVSGAILGASTLPFYRDPGDHSKNIFYGAALGAVVGVLFAAYAGVQEGPPDEEEASLWPKERRDALLLARSERKKDLVPQAFNRPVRGLSDQALIWAPVSSFKF